MKSILPKNDKFYFRRRDLINNKQLMVMNSINMYKLKVVKLYVQHKSIVFSKMYFDHYYDIHKMKFLFNYEQLTEEEFIKELLTGDYKEVYE